MQESNNLNQYTKTLERLENYDIKSDSATLALEFSEMKLIALDGCPESLLPRLFKLAHSIVNYDLNAKTNFYQETQQFIHPVYGALIQFFFQSHRQLGIEYEIQFFHDAAEIYHSHQLLSIAIALYRRAYEKSLRRSADDLLERILENKLSRLEILVCHYYFLKIESNKMASLESLETNIQRFLDIADSLVKENLVLELKQHYKLPLLTYYLESLAKELNRLAGEVENLKILQAFIESKLLALAERINIHAALDNLARERLSECYMIVYGIIHNHSIKASELTQHLINHEHKLSKQREDISSLQRNLQPALAVIWVNLMDRIASEAKKFYSINIENIDTLLSNYSHCIREIIYTVCKQIKNYLGEPPRDFILIGFGSISRDEMLPFSDLDICMLIDEDNLDRNSNASLRDHPYFTHFILLLNQLLKLVYGAWQCRSLSRDKENAPSYLRQQFVYEIVDTRLRIDSMDLAEMAAIISTPKEMAAWVVKQSAHADKNQNIKHQILAYGLLTPTALYASNERAFIKSKSEQRTDNDYPLLTAYLSNLGAKIAQPQQFIAQSKDEINSLITTWKKRENWSNDTAYLFVKRSLLVLDFWTMVWVFIVQKHYDPQHLQTLAARLKLLQHSNRCTPHFITSIQQFRQLLLLIKYQIDAQQPYKIILADETFYSYFMHTLLPAAYQLQQYQSLAQGNNDPFAELLLHVEKLKNMPLAQLIKSLSAKETVNWLRANRAKDEYYEKFYKSLLKVYPSTYIKEFIDTIKNDLGQQLHLFKRLINLPDEAGCRQSERLAYEQLFAGLAAVTQATYYENKMIPTVALTWFAGNGECHVSYILPAIAASIIDSKSLDIKRHYQNSLHAVAPINWGIHHLHIKQQPFQPLADYAINLLAQRLVGGGTSVNTLARLTVTFNGNTRNYPVLISQTASGETLRNQLANDAKLKLNESSYTALVLLALHAFPGDVTSRNLIINSEKEITLVDLEQHFIEPIVKKMSIKGLNKVQFCNILFCLEQADQPLNRQVIESFCALSRIDAVIIRWVDDIVAMEKLYLKLFAERERKQLYTVDKNQLFTPRFLVREGILASLLINANYLQIYLRKRLADNSLPSALDLLTQIDARLGYYYRQAYKSNSMPEKRLASITNDALNSVPSHIAINMSLGVVPSFDEIEKGERFNLNSAKKELLALANFKPDFSKIVTQTGQPDLIRQELMLKSLSIISHTELDLSNCAALNDEALKLVLAKSQQLKWLNLRGCPGITDASIIYLSQLPLLEKLSLSDNTGLKKITASAIFSAKPLIFPSLIELRISRCSALEIINVSGPCLERLISEECPKLIDKGSRVKQDQPVKPKSASPTLANKRNFHKIILTACYYPHLKILNSALSSSVPEGDMTVIGVDFEMLSVIDINNVTHRLQIWHLPEHERFAKISKAYARGCQLVLGIFNLRNSHEYEMIGFNINAYFSVNPDLSFVLIGSGYLPKQLLSDYQIDKMHLIQAKYERKYFHIIDPDDLDFEKIWLDRWLLAISSYSDQPDWLQRSQKELEEHFKKNYAQAFNFAQSFMQIKIESTEAINILRALNFVQLERFYGHILKMQTDKSTWLSSVYVENAKRVIFFALVKQNLSVAHRMYYLINNGELISYLNNPSVDKDIWRIMTDELCFALENGINDSEYDFSNHYFNDSDLVKLANSIPGNQSLQKLNLSANEFTNDGVIALCAGLCRNTSLSWLTLTQSKLDDTSIDSLVGWLKEATVINHLELSHNQFTDIAAEKIAEALSINSSLHCLNLAYNHFTFSGLIQLVDAFTNAPSLPQLTIWSHEEHAYDKLLVALCKNKEPLNRLDLSSMQLTDDYLMTMVYLVQKFKCPVTHLLLSGNKLREKGAVYLQDYLLKSKKIKLFCAESAELTDETFSTICKGLAENKALEKLSLSNNGISETGMAALAISLAKHTCLQHINLSNNKLKLAGSHCLANFLRENTSLEYLNISRNGLDDEGVAIIIEALIRSQICLKTFAIRGNKLASISCKLIGVWIATNFIKNNQGGNELDISYCGITNETLKELIANISDNNAINEIYLSENEFDESVYDLLCTLIKHCPQLTTLSITGFKINENYVNESFLQTLKWSRITSFKFDYDKDKKSSFVDKINEILAANKAGYSKTNLSILTNETAKDNAESAAKNEASDRAAVVMR